MGSLDNIKSSALSSKGFQLLSQIVENRLQLLESTDFQLWIQNKTPRSFHPFLKWALNNSLNSALDWIRPELHRHGFRLKKLNLDSLEAELNMGRKREIPLSLVLTALDESLKLFFNQHIPGQQFEMQLTAIQVEEKQKWDDALNLGVSFDDKKLDLDLALLQKNKNFDFENQMTVKIANKKTMDTLSFKVAVKLVPLLAFNKKGPQ